LEAKYNESQHFLVEGAAILVYGEWNPERNSVKTGAACTATAQLAQPDIEEGLIPVNVRIWIKH